MPPTYVDPGRQGEQKEYLVGLAKGTTWHTPVDVSSGILQFVEAINFPFVGPARIADPGIGRVFPMNNPSLGKIECKGDISLSALTYGQIDHLFAACMGNDSVATGSGYGTHTLTPAVTLWGHFYTLAYLFRGNDTVEFPSVKFTGFEISANPGEVAKGKFSGLADFSLTAMDSVRAGTLATGAGGTMVFTPTVSPAWTASQWIGLYFVVDASTASGDVGKSLPITANAAGTVTASGSLTAGAASGHIGPYNTYGVGGTFYATASEDYGDRLHFDDLVVRMGVSATGALATDGTCDFNVGAIKVAFERPMTGDYRSASTGANAMSKHAIWQPRDTDICKMSAEITFPNYDAQVAETMRYWMASAPASRRLEFIFTSTIMATGSTPYAFAMYFPACFISGNPATMPLSGGMPVTFKFEATYAADGTTLPSIVITNQRTAALLAVATTW